MIGPNEQPEAKPELQPLVDQSVVEGVTAGILGFIRKNNVKLAPTNKCEKPMDAFVSRLLSEYTPDPLGFPFKDSFKDFLLIRVAEMADTIKDLYAAGDIKSVIGLSRMEGGAATALFLEDHREEVLRLIRDIRGE